MVAVAVRVQEDPGRQGNTDEFVLHVPLACTPPELVSQALRARRVRERARQVVLAANALHHQLECAERFKEVLGKTIAALDSIANTGEGFSQEGVLRAGEQVQDSARLACGEANALPADHPLLVALARLCNASRQGEGEEEGGEGEDDASVWSVWFASKLVPREGTIGKLVNNNEKTKITTYIRQTEHGAPVRPAPVVDQGLINAASAHQELRLLSQSRQLLFKPL